MHNVVNDPTEFEILRFMWFAFGAKNSKNILAFRRKYLHNFIICDFQSFAALLLSFIRCFTLRNHCNDAKG